MAAFKTVTHGRATLLVPAKGGEAVEYALAHPDECTPVESLGRGNLLKFNMPGGPGLIRPYRRGGAMRLLLRDRFWLVNRPLREFLVHVAASQSGLSVTEPLGVRFEVTWLGLVSGAIATRALDAITLQEWLTNKPSEARTGMLRQCGAQIRAMHDAGIYHADLQIRNILITSEGPVIIDFDNARKVKQIAAWNRSRNLLRLRRSFTKNGFFTECFETVLEGYGPHAIPPWLDATYKAKGRISDWISMR